MYTGTYGLQNRPAGRPPSGALLLICQPSREAERRLCGVGRPAWMPGEPRWAMDGPWRRAHGTKPARGNLSAAKAVRRGEDLLVPFGSFQKGLDVRSKPISQLDTNAGYVPGGSVIQQPNNAPAPKKQANHDPHPKNRPNSDHIPNKSHSASAILEHIPINPH